MKAGDRVNTKFELGTIIRAEAEKGYLSKRFIVRLDSPPDRFKSMQQSQSGGKQMKERPIIFNTEMVRAILDGNKTETRRVIKPQPKRHRWEGFPSYKLECQKLRDNHYRFSHSFIDGKISNGEYDGPVIKCPYGEIGDSLWVRETWCKEWSRDSIVGTRIKPRYIADGYIPQEGMKKIPSIHMPKWAARIWLEITDIKVERVQDLTEKQFLAEGFGKVTKDGQTYKYGKADLDGYPGTDNYGWPWREWEANHIKAWGKIWNSIYKKRDYSWDDNPWVWVIKFNRINKA